MEKQGWWKNVVFYHIYIRSFKDTDGDGVGDLRGVIEKLDYLKNLGVGAILISPIYESPQEDFGYDITNFLKIEEEYGGLDDFRELITEAGKRGIRVLLDIVLGHTSDKHPWFLKSRSSRDNPKRDWYIWAKGKKLFGLIDMPPNNWLNAATLPGWIFDEKTKEWYFTSFLKSQPQLNLRNIDLRYEIFKIVKYWIDQGIDGFRLDLLSALIVDDDLSNNPFSLDIFPSDKDTSVFFQKREHTLNHPDSVEFLKELRNFINKNSKKEIFIIGEALGAPEDISIYCDAEGKKASSVFSFNTLSSDFSAKAYRGLVYDFRKHFQDKCFPTYVFSNHDRVRWISRRGNDVHKAKLNVAFQMTTFGIPFVYYGEEIGMHQSYVSIKDSLDELGKRWEGFPEFVTRFIERISGEHLSRDGARTPMQWNSSKHAGFTAENSVKPWLPADHHSQNINVMSELQDPASLLHCYKKFIRLRNERVVLQSGGLRFLHISDLEESIGDRVKDQVLAFSRYDTGDTENNVDTELFVFLNFSDKEISVRNSFGVKEVLASTHSTRVKVDDSVIKLKAYEGLVLS